MEKKHILLVDDDGVVRRLFGGILASAGFEVIYAEDGNVGREMARRFQPDLILLDIDMPVLDGIKTANILKKEQQTTNIPIVLFTNSDLSIEAENAVKELGITEYIPKAIDPKKFIDLIKTAISKPTSKNSISNLM